MKDTTPRAPAETLQAGITFEGLGYLSNWGGLWKESPRVPGKAETRLKHGGKTRVGREKRRQGEREREKERERCCIPHIPSSL